MENEEVEKIRPVVYITNVIENKDSWSVTIEIPKPIIVVPRVGGVYSLEIIQDKQSILDRLDRNKPNPFVGACHIPDPLNRDYCMLCGKKLDKIKEE